MLEIPKTGWHPIREGGFGTRLAAQPKATGRIIRATATAGRIGKIGCATKANFDRTNARAKVPITGQVANDM